MQSSIWAVYQLDDDVYYYNAERLKLNREMEKYREVTPAAGYSGLREGWVLLKIQRGDIYGVGEVK